VAQQLTALATKRAWAAAEAGAILQRLPLHTALQLLLESDISRSRGAARGGGSGGSWMGRHRGKLLLCLIDWHGFEEIVGAMRTLFAQYKQASIASFAGLLADLQPAWKAGSCFLTTSSSSSGGGSGVWGLPGNAPNPYVAAVLHVLGVMRGLGPAADATPGSSSSSSWEGQLARLLCLLDVLTPDDVSNDLAEAVGRSFAAFGESFMLKAAGKVTAQPAAAAATDSWQVQAAALLAALPAAAATTAGKGYGMWGPLAVAVTAGVATAAGGAAMLPALQLAVSSSSSSSTLGGNGLAVHLSDLLQQLQTAGLLTCGVHFNSSSSSVTGGYPSSSSSSSSDSVPAAACINLQLVLLLQRLYQTDKVLTLQQALQALVTLAPTLGKTLPQAVVYLFGHPKARGYGANLGPDTAVAMAAMEEAVAAAAVPTGAAVPAAVATAGKQLSEVLAYLHELLPAAAMQKMITALAAALPWDSDDSSSSSSGKMCPSDSWSQQQGWQGVSCKQLISSSLLTASCAMWGFDKGTGVAHSLIVLLADAAAANEASTAAAATTPAFKSRTLQRSSRIAGGFEGTHAGRAQQALLHAAGSAAAAARSSSSHLHSDRAAAAFLQAATGSGAAAAAASHAAAAGAALRNAAASGAAPAAAAHASRAAAAIHRAASTGVSHNSSSSSSNSPNAAGMNTVGHPSHAQRAQHALLWAAASAGSSPSGSHAERAQSQLLAAAAAAAAGDSAVLWALQQIRDAVEHYSSEDGSMSMSTARAAVARVLTNAADTFAVADGESGAAAALLSALPQLFVPPHLAAQVLVETYDLVSASVWSQSLQAAAAAAAAAATARTSCGGSSAVLQLLLALVQEVQLQLRVNVKGPVVYAEVLLAAADSNEPASQREEAVGQLLQLMLSGGQATAAAAAAAAGVGGRAGALAAAAPAFRGVPLAASAAAQLVIELARRRTSPSSSSSGGAGVAAASEEDAAARQLLVVGVATSAILQHFSSSSSTSVLVNCIAGQIYQTALLPQLYLTLLLRPRVSSSQWITLVRQSGLTSGNTPQAAAALALLCNTLKPGKALPLAAYAAALATALDVACTDSTNVAYPEARVGLELEKQQRQQQLLEAVVTVLGRFRGMRAMHASPLAAQLLLPKSDLAAVLCYCQELLPADTATALAAAVARALGQLDASSSSSSQQLVQLLAQLPNAAAAAFGKGAELWMPLLQQMAVAGGMSDAEEAQLISKLTAVAGTQGLAVPVRIAASEGASDDGGVRFADPAAAAAARGAAGTAKTAAAAAVTSHPVPVTAADVDDNDGAFDVTENALEVFAAVSLSVASTAATAALAAGYGAAGALVGLVWGAAAMTAGALAVSGGEASSSIKDEASTAAPVAPAAATAAKGGDGAAVSASTSPPDSPRTPTICEATSALACGSSDIHRAAMGGRTKADKPAAAAGGAAAFGYGGAATAAGAAAAAAAAAGQGSGLGFGSGFGVLGSLAVDPDEVVRKIRSQSAHMPLDEAVMQVRQFAVCCYLCLLTRLNGKLFAANSG
jgi:hypothetical protein